MKTRVTFNKKATKDIKKLPQFIRIKLYIWIKLINENGLYEARHIKGFNDEGLKGYRRGHSAQLDLIEHTESYI